MGFTSNCFKVLWCPPHYAFWHMKLKSKNHYDLFHWIIGLLFNFVTPVVFPGVFILYSSIRQKKIPIHTTPQLTHSLTHFRLHNIFCCAHLFVLVCDVNQLLKKQSIVFMQTPKSWRLTKWFSVQFLNMRKRLTLIRRYRRRIWGEWQVNRWGGRCSWR